MVSTSICMAFGTTRRAPNTVFLVVGWFGDDLRCGSCTIRPKVEVANKVTTPDAWMVHGIARSGALVMSLNAGKPAYGGTPSDDTVVRAVRDLKARGYAVVFYPFLFMDVPAGNTLPNAYGGAGQSTGMRRSPIGATAPAISTGSEARPQFMIAPICNRTSKAASSSAGSMPATRREPTRHAPPSRTAPMASPGCSDRRICGTGG